MSYAVNGTTITMTRGDTFKAYISVYDGNRPYKPQQGDRIRFAMKQRISDLEPLIIKDIPVDTLMLVLDPEDTKDLEFGTYIYDIELTTALGDVDTFITKSQLNLTEEVH